jgi:hypothetical protein
MKTPTQSPDQRNSIFIYSAIIPSGEFIRKGRAYKTPQAIIRKAVETFLSGIGYQTILNLLEEFDGSLESLERLIDDPKLRRAITVQGYGEPVITDGVSELYKSDCFPNLPTYLKGIYVPFADILDEYCKALIPPFKRLWRLEDQFSFVLKDDPRVAIKAFNEFHGIDVSFDDFEFKSRAIDTVKLVNSLASFYGSMLKHGGSVASMENLLELGPSEATQGYFNYLQHTLCPDHSWEDIYDEYLRLLDEEGDEKAIDHDYFSVIRNGHKQLNNAHLVKYVEAMRSLGGDQAPQTNRFDIIVYYLLFFYLQNAIKLDGPTIPRLREITFRECVLTHPERWLNFESALGLQ